MIREATIRDIPAIVGLTEEAWSKTPYAHIPTSPAQIMRSAQQQIADKHSLVLVSDKPGMITGILSAQVSPMMGTNVLGASDNLFYCKSGEGAALIRRYVEWARGRGAVVVGMTVSSGSRRAGELIARAGFDWVGGNYYLFEGDDEQSAA